MSKHPIRKAAGLVALYSIIIIGIFVLQFKNESVISRNTGLLRMSVAQTQSQDGQTSLKNQFTISFKGISFSGDEVHPVELSTGTEQIPLTLLSWDQEDPLSFTLRFSEDTALTFTVTDTTSKASLSVIASLPKTAESLSLPYKPASGYSVTEQTKTRQTVSSKNNTYNMSASSLEDSLVTFRKNSIIASYQHYDPTTVFTFTVLPSDMAEASENTYLNHIRSFTERMLSLTESSLQDSTQFTENAAVAYVAERARRGEFSEALDMVPDSFKKGSKRTYFSAPYFDSLISMNASLVMVNDNMHSMIKNAVNQKTLDIFAVNSIAEFILREQANPDVRALLQLPASMSQFMPSTVQAAGILHTYIFLKNSKSHLADYIEPAVDLCLQTIETNCHWENPNLTISEKAVPLSFIQTIETGKVLIDYGSLSSREEYQIAGRLLINTAFTQSPNADLRTLAEIYPILVKNNTFYPHETLLHQSDGNLIWAWNVASNMEIKDSENGNVTTLTIDFPQGKSHYMIINGIKPFEDIEIYGISFHTDPRFETYNSSGYVYDDDTRTLFLKSRHKSGKEKIILTYKMKRATPPRQSVAPKETANQSTTETSSTTTDSSASNNQDSQSTTSSED